MQNTLGASRVLRHAGTAVRFAGMDGHTSMKASRSQTIGQAKAHVLNDKVLNAFLQMALANGQVYLSWASSERCAMQVT